MRTILSCAILLLVCGRGLARSIGQGEKIIAVVPGTLYALEPSTGQTQYRLDRRHLGAMNDSRVQAMRLDLGQQVGVLDMELTQDSVWTDDSKVVVRRGEHVEEIHDFVDKNCFLSGPLTSHSGAVSLNRCGRMHGIVQAGDYHYEIEEEGGEADDASNSNSELLNVKVTMKRSEDANYGNAGFGPLDDALGPQKGEIEDFEKNLLKRQLRPVTSEIAIYLDSNFINWKLRNSAKTPTIRSLTQWLVNKWNLIRKIYGDEANAGVKFTVQLKKIEFWRTNPVYYARLGSRAETGEYLRVFCRNTDALPDYDHKMLYTQGLGQQQMGLAFSNGICRDSIKCSLVKAKAGDIKVEIHEFGHNLGLPHDPDFPFCTDRTGNGGFMAWGTNYDWLDCYRRKLSQTLIQPGARCLYYTNVPNLPVLNVNP